MIHFHKYKAVKENRGYGTTFNSLTFEKTASGVPMTTILYKCEKCSKIKVKTIEGHFTLEEIK